MTIDFSKEKFNTELMPDPNFMRTYIEDFKPTRKFIKKDYDAVFLWYYIPQNT